MNETLRRRRTLAMVFLVLAVVLIPCSAWFVVGQRAARQQATELRAEPRLRGQQIARAFAERLRGRLEAIRDAESQRPASQYSLHPSQTDDRCECGQHDISPLLTGPHDPFVEAYFEINGHASLELPILSADPGLQPDPDRYQHAWERAAPLRAAVPDILASLDAQTPPGDPLAPASFAWHQIELSTGPTLIALRRSGEGAARRVQGFVLSEHAVTAWLETADLPSKLRPMSAALAAHEVAGEVPLDCTSWEIVLDVGNAGAEADARAAAVLAGFRRNFGIGATAALLAALSLVALILSAERQSRQRARFAASAAHELRTPLAGLRLYGEMLRDGIDDPERSARYAGRIAEESERLSRVVTNVLGFTRLERGTLEVSPTALSLKGMLQPLVDHLGPALRSQGAELVLEDIAPDDLRIQADPEVLEQILRNLIDNAEKYSRNSSDRRIVLAAHADGSEVEILVRDHGPGIDPALANRIFRPFIRGDATDQPAGLGLGLALALELAHAQGARLDFENDGGAVFRLHFDRA